MLKYLASLILHSWYELPSLPQVLIYFVLIFFMMQLSSLMGVGGLVTKSCPTLVTSHGL